MAKCKHEAWEEYGRSRTCADCGEVLPLLPADQVAAPVSERTQALQDAVDAIRAACALCAGSGRVVCGADPQEEECGLCRGPIAAVKALMGGSK